MSDELQNYYPVFDSNQVLTKNQLNDLRNYLDEQNRIQTRVKLIGTGIINGFSVKYNAALGLITITGGLGLSSNGHMLEYKTARTFDKIMQLDEFDPSHKLWGEENLYELLPTEDDCDCGEFLKNVPASLHLEDKVVVLYLQQIEETKLCTEDSYKIGKKKTFSIRVLLCDKDNPKITFPNAPINIKTPRITELSNIRTEKQIDLQYKNIITNYSSKLASQLGLLYSFYGETFNLQHWNDDTTSVQNTLLNINFNVSVLQYGYAFMKDISLALNEFNINAFQIFRQHYKELDSYKNYLMLGKVNSANVLEDDYYRNNFAKAAIIESEKFKKVQILYYRILLMINGADTHSDDYRIKITPSNFARIEMGDRAIPYYYKNIDTLVKYWNPEKAISNAWSSVQSYNQEIYNTTDIPTVAEPFSFEIDENNFFRIEGHVGHDYEYVVNELTRLRKDFNLPFNIITLRIQQGDFNNDFNEDYYTDDVDRNHTYVFKEFVKKFPGMEHHSGVPIGGTFILVINKENITVGDDKRKVVYDFCLPYAFHGDTMFESVGYMNTFVLKYMAELQEQTDDEIYDEFPGIGPFLLDEYFD